MSAPAEPLIRAENVRKRFGDSWILRGVSLDVYKGEVLVVIGPSGSGKTTLVRCMNALGPIDGGRITVGGERMGCREHRGRIAVLPERLIARQRRHVGMVFQRFNLFPHMTALDNVMVAPIRVLGRRTLMPSNVAAVFSGLPTPPPDGAIAVRPENLRLERQAGLIVLGEARVATVVFQGSYKRVLAVSTARSDLVFIARVEAGAAITPGDICTPGCRPEDLIILPR
jgi:ABC-type uncharacterized transport system YnjBCD ATPase subunit